MSKCSGCKLIGIKNCIICSRKYDDLYEPKTPPRPELPENLSKKDWYRSPFRCSEAIDMLIDYVVDLRKEVEELKK